MSCLFDKLKVGAIEVSNRIAMAPMTRNRSPKAVPQPITATYYGQRATAGLIITEAVAISHQAQGYADVPGLYSDEQIKGWRKVTDEVHQKGGKIYAQIWHVGRVSHTSLQPDGAAPVAPSAIQAKTKIYIYDENGHGSFVETSMPRALEKSELPKIVDDFAKAARRAVKEAGFDGVEIHAANGYLIDQFLRSDSNQRDDDYGGSIENRARFLFEVVEAVIAEIGAEHTAIRLSPVTPSNDAHDHDPQPLFDYVVDALAAYDLAFIHVIEGATGGDRSYQEVSYSFDYKRFKQVYLDAGGKAAWMVNNGYDRAMAEDAVQSGYADLVSFGRPFIANPDLVRRIKENAALNEGDPSTFYGGGEKGYTDYSFL